MSTQITQKFTERMREFDERDGRGNFVHDAIGEENFNRIKSFLRDTVIAVLEEEREKVNYNLVEDENEIGLTDFDCGYNSANAETIAALDLTIKEIGEI